MARTTVDRVYGLTSLRAIGDLRLWLDASQLTGLNDGDPVSTWTDYSGNGFHAVQSGSNRPLYKTGIVNSKPVIRFVSASTNYMTIPRPLLLDGPTLSGTIFIVSKQITSSGTGMLCLRNGTDGWVFRYNSATQTTYFHTGQSGTQTQTVVDQFNIHQVRRNGLNVEMGVNGTLAASGAMAGYTASAAPANYIGVVQSNLTAPLNGDIAEIIIFGRKLSDTEQLQVCGYLGAKYNITVPAYTSISRSTASGRSTAGARSAA